MGFMDKAKKMAEQAQQKLDDVQKNFNEGQGSGGQQQGGPAVEYDKHGRPVNAPAGAEAPPSPQPSAPAAGDPLADPAPSPVAGAPATPAPGAPEAPAPSAHPTPDPAAPGAAETSEPAKVEGDPLLADEPGSRQGADAERDAAAKPPSGGAPGMTSGDPLG